MKDIVDVARSWIGTPYVHQAACRNAGCDCLGLLRGIWAEVSETPLIAVPPYTADWSEPQGAERLWEELAQRLSRKSRCDDTPGDVLLFRMREGAVAKHLALQAEIGARATFIHSYQGHGVTESAFSAPWRRRLVARFALPEHNFSKG